RVDDAHVLNAASLWQPLAKAATRLRVHGKVARVMGEGVYRIPPAADLVGQGGVHRRRRCVDRGGVPYGEAGGGGFEHLAAHWSDEQRAQDRNDQKMRSHDSVMIAP